MKFKHIILFIACSTGLYSCKDFLEEEPLDVITVENFYNTDRDIDEGVNAAYSVVSSQWSQRMHIVTELRADYVKPGPQAQSAGTLLPFDLFSYDNLNSNISDLWSGFYKAIDNANIIIEKVPFAAKADSSHKLRVVAEARFLRAYSYYNLVRLWGPVPLKLTSTASSEGLQLPKNTEDEVYQVIIDDLLFAAGETGENPGLPLSYTGTDNGRITLGAAQSLLAEVYLTKQNWTQAAIFASKVIEAKKYDLWTNYLDAFLFTNKYKANTAPNGEAIFEIQFDHNAGLSTIITRWTAPRGALYPNVSAGRSGMGNYTAIPAAYKMFSSIDSRREAIFPKTYINQSNRAIQLNPFPNDTNNYYIMKYRLDGQDAAFGNSANNWPIFRLAEVLLIHAESINEFAGPTPEAYASINRVRKRAKLADLTPGLSQPAFRDSVYAERAKELFLEGDRFFDLVRTGRFVPVMSKVVPGVTEANRFLPIPQSERDLNPNLN